MDPRPTRWSTLIIRAWVTDGEPVGLRARLSRIDDGLGPPETVAVAGDVEAILSVARNWLGHLQRSSPAGDP